MGKRIGIILASALFLSPLASLPVQADFHDGLVMEASAGESNLQSLVEAELQSIEVRRAEVIKAYNTLGVKLSEYNGWCSTYGLTALQKIVRFRTYSKMFSFMAYPFYHVYANDPYFSRARGSVDKALDSLRVEGLDVGACVLTEKMSKAMQNDPKQFDPSQDEFSGTSFAYALLAGNFRLIEEERSILLELKGFMAGARGSEEGLKSFASQAYLRLKDNTTMLRARTLQGYEFGFRIPLGPLETYRGKSVGHKEGDAVPSFFFLFERRAFYVNQARLAAGKLFERSVRNFTQAELLQDSLLEIAGR